MAIDTLFRAPEGCRFIKVQDWQVAACDFDHCAAVMIHVLERWHIWKLMEIEKGPKLNDIREQHGDERVHNETSVLQFHTKDDMERELLYLYGVNSIRRAEKLLVEKGFVTIHKNPNPRYSFDKTVYYQLHYEVINSWLETYDPQSFYKPGKTPSVKNNCPSVKNNESSVKKGGRSVKSNGRSVKKGGAITQNTYTENETQNTKTSASQAQHPQKPLPEPVSKTFPLDESFFGDLPVPSERPTTPTETGFDPIPLPVKPSSPLETPFSSAAAFLPLEDNGVSLQPEVNDLSLSRQNKQDIVPTEKKKRKEGTLPNEFYEAVRDAYNLNRPDAWYECSHLSPALKKHLKRLFGLCKEDLLQRFADALSWASQDGYWAHKDCGIELLISSDRVIEWSERYRQLSNRPAVNSESVKIAETYAILANKMNELRG